MSALSQLIFWQLACSYLSTSVLLFSLCQHLPMLCTDREGQQDPKCYIKLHNQTTYHFQLTFAQHSPRNSELCPPKKLYSKSVEASVNSNFMYTPYNSIWITEKALLRTAFWEYYGLSHQYRHNFLILIFTFLYNAQLLLFQTSTPHHLHWYNNFNWILNCKS